MSIYYNNTNYTEVKKKGNDVMDLYDIKQELNRGKTLYDLPLRVTYYARVSTDKDEQIHSLQNQINYYSDFISKNANWTYIEGYIDEGISGTSVSKRDSFLKMIDDAKLGKFDFIITKEISRFSRNTLDSIKYTQELLHNGVGVYFQSDNINTLLPDSELRLTIMSSMAQDEVRKISERVKFGFKRAIEKGVVLGNNKIWGYKKDNGKLIIDEEQAEMVKLIFELYATQRMGIRAIANELSTRGYVNTEGNRFAFSTVRNILLNPKYKGYYCGKKTQKYDYRSNDRKVFDEQDWVMYKNEVDVPPIVSEELWEKANKILSKRSQSIKGDKHISYNNKYSYSGKIVCSKHNCSYQRGLYRYASGNKEVWQCKEYLSKGRSGCDMPILYTTELNEIMKQCYNELITNRADIIHDLVKIYSSIATKSSIKQDMAKCKIEINDILKRKDKLLDLSIAGKISDDEFEKRNNSFNKEIDSLKVKIEDFEKQEEANEEIEKSIEVLRKIIAKELDFENGFNNSIVDSLLDKIEVFSTEQKNVIDLKVHIRVIDDVLEYRINRGRKNTSVCNNHYT
ncbi:MAG: recombinase family protein [Clostridia bacterium]|nr:recombinase family protein [Clostridia bacterium]